MPRQPPKPPATPAAPKLAPKLAAKPASARAPRTLPALTAAILELVRRGGLSDAHTRVGIGKLLGQAQQMLPHGKWLEWLDREVPFEPRSAQNYIGLAAWAEARPAVFERIAPLGPKKLYRLVRVADPTLAELLARDDTRAVDLERMSYDELNELLRKLENKPLPPEAALALRAATRSARSLLRALGALVPHAPDLPPDELDDLRDLLTAALTHFDTELDPDD